MSFLVSLGCHLLDSRGIPRVPVFRLKWVKGQEGFFWGGLGDESPNPVFGFDQGICSGR